MGGNPLGRSSSWTAEPGLWGAVIQEEEPAPVQAGQAKRIMSPVHTHHRSIDYTEYTHTWGKRTSLLGHIGPLELLSLMIMTPRGT